MSRFERHVVYTSFSSSLNLPPTSSRTSCNIWVQIGNSSLRFIYHPRQWGFIYQGKRYLDLLNADITMRRIVILCGAVSMPAILHQRYCWIVNRRVVARSSHAGCSCYGYRFHFPFFSYNLRWWLLLTPYISESFQVLYWLYYLSFIFILMFWLCSNGKS